MRIALLAIIALGLSLSSCKSTDPSVEQLQACECNTYEVHLNDSAIIALPAMFSPNGDSINERYAPFIVGADSFRFKVLNGNQEILLNTDTLGVGWDGTIAGVGAGPGKYYFTLYAKFSNTLDTAISGNFCLVRDCITSNLSGGCTTAAMWDGESLNGSLPNREAFPACEE